jgi:uncharacterized DUF497 family protein
VQYEWDARKARTNLAKHGVPFPEATTVFLDPLAVTFDDPDHSADEQRFITIGRSTADRVLFVATAERAERIRIISARDATRREAHGYEEGQFSI